MQVEYRNISPAELNIRLFSHFTRHQVVTDCLRRSGDRWEVRSNPFTDDWSNDDYERLVGCLINTLQTGGAVFGAFIAGELKGFASVEAMPLGSRGQYIDLSCLHVSEELRHRGIGTVLFGKAAEWAASRGAENLYISSHSAVETQAFYRRMGCTDAEEYSDAHVTAEPYDRQLEFALPHPSHTPHKA